MGIANMDFIAKRLMECGKDPKTPLAFIEKGTTPYQRTVMATLETAGETIVRENVTAPAITIMGGVVELGKSLAWKKNLPLSGKRLVVTRAAKQASGITARLTALGAEVIETPMIETRSVDGCFDWASLANFDILAFTSTNGVESFFKQLLASGRDIRILAGKKIASVGKITEKKLLEYGIRCDYVPEDHTGEGLGMLLASLPADYSRILLLQGNLADDTLLKLLPQATRWVVYETLPVAQLPEWKREAVAGADAIVFASTSAVENFCAIVPDVIPAQAGNSSRLAFCIGRMTEAAARKQGFETVTSDETTMDSLVKKITEYFYLA
jgi:uroporphyrinogen III methyltransferase/synthase